MNSSSNSNVPAWVKDPKELINQLANLEFYDDSLLSTVTVTEPDLFKRQVTQFYFWKRQLIPSITSHTAVFALLGPKGLEIPDILNVFYAAKQLCDISGAFEFYQAANTKFIGVSFHNAEDVTEFIQKFQYYQNSLVAYVLPPHSRSRAFSMLWLPPLFPISRVRVLLGKYSSSFTSQHGQVKVGPNQYMRSSAVRGTLVLREDQDVEDIPHLIPLPKPHKGHALLIIAGREHFCLKCLTRGHLRKDCHIQKCPHCNFHHLPSVTCEVKSYAKRVAGSSSLGDNYCWPDDVTGAENNVLLLESHPTASIASAHVPEVPALIIESSNISPTPTITHPIPIIPPSLITVSTDIEMDSQHFEHNTFPITNTNKCDLTQDNPASSPISQSSLPLLHIPASDTPTVSPSDASLSQPELHISLFPSVSDMELNDDLSPAQEESGHTFTSHESEIIPPSNLDSHMEVSSKTPSTGKRHASTIPTSNKKTSKQSHSTLTEAGAALGAFPPPSKCYHTHLVTVPPFARHIPKNKFIHHHLFLSAFQWQGTI